MPRTTTPGWIPAKVLNLFSSQEFPVSSHLYREFITDNYLCNVKQQSETVNKRIC